MPDKKHTIIIWLLFAILMIIASPSFAEVKVFEREYTYQASEVDSTNFLFPCPLEPSNP